mgnify:CR=1 FL=1
MSHPDAASTIQELEAELAAFRRAWLRFESTLGPQTRSDLFLHVFRPLEHQMSMTYQALRNANAIALQAIEQTAERGHDFE